MKKEEAVKTDGKSKIETDSVKGKIEKLGKTKKSIVSVIGILGVILIITFISFVNAQFSGAKIKTWQFWVNLAIMVALGIYSMVMGERLGDDIIKNNENSNFRKTLAKYTKIYDSLLVGVYFSYFADWLEGQRLKKKRKDEMSFLKSCGIHQMEVLELDRSELHNLIHPYRTQVNGKTVTFKSLTKAQIEAIEYVFDGNIKVSVIEDEWFKTGVDYKTKDMWESASKASTKKLLLVNEARVFKIATICALSCLTNTLIPGESGDGASKQMMIDYASRIGTIMMAVVSGIFVAWQAINIDRDYLNFKISKLTLFKNEFDSGLYKHETFEEQANRAYEEWERKQEEARNSVVTPEISPMIESKTPMIGGPQNGDDGREEGKAD